MSIIYLLRAFTFLGCVVMWDCFVGGNFKILEHKERGLNGVMIICFFVWFIHRRQPSSKKAAVYLLFYMRKITLQIHVLCFQIPVACLFDQAVARCWASSSSSFCNIVHPPGSIPYFQTFPAKHQLWGMSPTLVWLCRSLSSVSVSDSFPLDGKNPDQLKLIRLISQYPSSQ